MADVFNEMNDALLKVARGLEKTTAGLKVATDGLTETASAFTRTVELSRVAHDEQEDLRETVHRLEGLVMDLVKDVRELRTRSNGKGE